MSMAVNRINSFDYAKGLMIFFVVWMHCIQHFGNHLLDYVLPSIVYSFHMPVFMIVSGYLFAKRLGGEWKDVLPIVKKQFCRLIIPNIVYGGVFLIVKNDIRWAAILRLPFTCWFLSTLFVVSCLYLVFSLLQKNPLIVVIIGSLIVLLIPVGEFTKFMMPFFGIGWIFFKYGLLERLMIGRVTMLITFVSVLLLTFVWDSKLTIYQTPSPTPGYINDLWFAYIIRIVIGTTASVYLLGLVKYIEKDVNTTKILYRFSQNSLGIYVIHTCLFDLLKNSVVLPEYSEWTIVFLCLLITGIAIAVINIFFKCLRINKYIARLTLGEQW